MPILKRLFGIVKVGRFREDLYYRLKTTTIHLPTLRDRGDDVLLLGYKFLDKYSQLYGKKANGFGLRAEKLLLHYEWPGNVRQLQKCIEGLVLLNEGEKITSEMLLAALADEQPIQTEDTTTNLPQPTMPNQALLTPHATKKYFKPLWQVEKEAILEAIKYRNGNVVKAAKLLIGNQ
jgi:transcriptional regulator with PAS, ATPase and Fis domain